MQTKFTAEHYQLMAITMRNATPPAAVNTQEGQQHYADCKAIATMLASDNPWFNTNMFLYKCGYHVEGMRHDH